MFMWTTCVDEVGTESDHRDEAYEAPKGKYVLYNDGHKLDRSRLERVA